MFEQVTTFEETKAFSCPVKDVKDEINVNSKAAFKRSS